MRKINLIIIFILINIFAFSQLNYSMEAFATSQNILLIIDPSNGEILDVSEGARNFYSYNKLIGMKISEINTLSVEEVQTEMTKAKEEERNYFKFRHILNNGKVKDVEVNSYPMTYKGKHILFSTIRDVTEQVHADFFYKALEYIVFFLLTIIVFISTISLLKVSETSKKFRELFDNMLEAFAYHEIIYNEQGKAVDYRFLDINSKFEEIIGLKKESVIGKKVKDILPQTEEYWIENYAKVAKTQEPIYFRNFSQEFGKYYDCYAFSPRKNQFAVVFSDVTEQELAKIELEEYKNNLEKIINKRTIELLKYSVIVEQSSTIIVMTDTSGNLEYVNPKFVEVTGYMPEEVIGKNSRILKSGITPQETFVDLWKTITSGKPWRGELCNKSKSGELFWEDASIFPVKNENGIIINYVAVKEDITERVRSENEIKLLLKSVSEGIIAVDLSGKVKIANEAAHEILRSNEESLTGMEICDVLYKARMEANEFVLEDCHIYNSIQKKEKIVVPIDTFSRMDDTIFDVEFTSVPIINKGILEGAVVVFRDVTEKLKTQKEIKESRTFLEKVFQATPVPVFITSHNIKKLFKINQAFLDYFGASEKELLAADVKDVLINFEEDSKKLYNSFKEGQAIELKVRKYKKEGYSWVILRGREIEYKGELCFLTSFVDVTDIKKAREKAEKATEAKSNFLANMSHEIRTPMNAIIGLNSLLFNTKLTNKQKEYIEKISNSAQNLLRIINDILDFSKIEAGKLKIEHIDFDINHVLEDLVNGTAIKAHEKKLEFIIICDHKIENNFIGDPLRLQQVLLNLVNNAIKFTELGEVVIEVKEESHINNISKLKFIVKDTGIGMTEEQISKLFNSFTQADDSTTRKYGGTGLGLSISRLLVKLMNGEISVNSVYGKGTTFTFTLDLPISKNIEENENIALDSIKDLKILVVEDNDHVKKALAESLINITDNIKFISSSTEAIKEVIKEDYNLVILDNTLPDLNGLNTWKKIKHELEKDKLPKLILMSPYGEEHFEYLALNFEIDNILYKPILKKHLQNSIIENFTSQVVKKARYSLLSKYPEGFDSIRGAKILLVEDNQINQEVAKELLLFEEFWVDVAENGHEAIEMISKKEYDLILLDLQMPVLDGFETTKVLRNEYKLTELPIIALSANAISGTKKQVLEAGMNDYLSKPINKNELFRVLSKWIKPFERERSKYSQDDRVDSDKISILKELLNSIDVKEGLARVSGNVELFISVLSKFLHEYEDFVSHMHELLNKSDKSIASHLIHTLKGTAGNISAKNLKLAALELEKSIQAEDSLSVERFSEEMKVLKTELDIIISEIKMLLYKLNDSKVEHENIVLSISDEEFTSEFRRLGELLENYNTEAFLVCEKVSRYIVDEEAKSKFDNMTKFIEDYEYDDAIAEYEDVIKILSKNNII